MEKIKLIIRENLNKRYTLTESFMNISLNENEDVRFRLGINKLGSLIDNGYTENDLNNVIEEQWDWLKKIFTPGNSKSNPSDVKSQNDILSTAGHGATSQLKEYLISKFLGMFGFTGRFANAISTAMSEMTLMDIVSIFRNKNACLANSSVVSNAVIESILRYILETGTKKDSLVYNFIRNTFMEYFKKTSFSKQVGVFVCNGIEQFKSKLI